MLHSSKDNDNKVQDAVFPFDIKGISLSVSIGITEAWKQTHTEYCIQDNVDVISGF